LLAAYGGTGRLMLERADRIIAAARTFPRFLAGRPGEGHKQVSGQLSEHGFGRQVTAYVTVGRERGPSRGSCMPGIAGHDFCRGHHEAEVLRHQPIRVRSPRDGLKDPC
jgi:hypothetical protein